MRTRPAPSQGEAVAALAIDALRVCGRLRLRATGASMLPSVHPGDELRFESCTHAQAEPGDVVLFRRGGRFFIHRVVARTEQGLLTQGDANAQPDPPVDAADVLGRMVAHQRGERVLPLNSPRRLRMTRWLFDRSTLAARVFLRLQRIAPQKTA